MKIEQSLGCCCPNKENRVEDAARQQQTRAPTAQEREYQTLHQQHQDNDRATISRKFGFYSFILINFKTIKRELFNEAAYFSYFVQVFVLQKNWRHKMENENKNEGQKRESHGKICFNLLA